MEKGVSPQTVIAYASDFKMFTAHLTQLGRRGLTQDRVSGLSTEHVQSYNFMLRATLLTALAFST